MSVRQNVYNVLNHSSVTTLLADGASGIHAGASLTGVPYPLPYLVYRVQTSVSELRGDDGDQAALTTVEVWVYDKPGTYKIIEQVLDAVKARFAVSDVLRSRWNGDSIELSDDELKAVVKYGSYGVAERVLV